MHVKKVGTRRAYLVPFSRPHRAVDSARHLLVYHLFGLMMAISGANAPVGKPSRQYRAYQCRIPFGSVSIIRSDCAISIVRMKTRASRCSKNVVNPAKKLADGRTTPGSRIIPGLIPGSTGGKPALQITVPLCIHDFFTVIDPLQNSQTSELPEDHSYTHIDTI